MKLLKSNKGSFLYFSKKFSVLTQNIIESVEKNSFETKIESKTETKTALGRRAVRKKGAGQRNLEPNTLLRTGGTPARSGSRLPAAIFPLRASGKLGNSWVHLKRNAHTVICKGISVLDAKCDENHTKLNVFQHWMPKNRISN